MTKPRGINYRYSKGKYEILSISEFQCDGTENLELLRQRRRE
jgi:hypothetical protein